MGSLTPKAARTALAVLAAMLFLAIAAATSSAEEVRIGILKTTSAAPVYLALDRGYFQQEGLQPKIVTFDSAQPIAVAVVSGSLDFGVTGLTSAFFNLAGQGALKIVAGAYSEHRGFHYNALVASKHAYAAGLTSLKLLPGHSFSISQVGSPPHYAIGAVADKLGFDLKSLRLLPLQSIPNQVSAIAGGQVDAAMLQASIVLPLIEKGDVKMLGWLSDEISWQVGVVFTSTKTADSKADTVRRVLGAIAKGRRDYVDAFIGPDGKLKEGSTSAAVLALIAKHINQAPDQVKLGLIYMDEKGRLDEQDVLHQIAWYKSHGMLKPEVNGKAMIDSRYVVPLTAQ